MRKLLLASILALSVSSILVACGDDSPSLVSNNEGNNQNNNNGQLGVEGATCREGTDCVSGLCELLTQTCTGGSCIDGKQTGDESDVDCGAIGCARCDIGQGCDEDIDCVSGICNDNTCRDMNCTDGMKNGLESDVDCGGLCSPCADGDACRELSDCESSVCEDDVCLVPSCDDRVQNGAETDQNCGGPCDPCADEQGCSVSADCVSGVCTGGLCAVPACDDSVANAAETDVDCGGKVCGDCADGKICKTKSDCQSLVCDKTLLTCTAPACNDSQTNGTETDRDCGGSCVACDPKKDCLVGTDCASKICGADFKCTYPVCDDSVTNGEETDLDCGGDDCESCANLESCLVASDCLSRVCTGGICQPGQCNDGQMNGSETDVDCGGSCAPCGDGLQCAGVAANCQSDVCTSNKCRAATCSDGVTNADETDVDCGGGTCTDRCTTNLECNFGGDCESGVCHPTAKTCEPARCDDSVINGDESDVDCGGSCPLQCQLGQTCGEDIDCNTAVCDGGVIGPICSACREGATQTLNTRCGYGNRGQIVQACVEGIWVNDSCANVWYGSCKEILADNANAQTGEFNIDPDGPDPLYSPFEVYCDMTTNGGGWTEVLVCTAKNDLRGELVGIDQAKKASIQSCKPVTQDLTSDNHTYHYTFDFPSGFSQFRFSSYELKANADGGLNHTSDLGYIQTSWNVAGGFNRGDVSFGSAGAAGPVRSFSRTLGSRSCTDCTIQWPANQNGPHGVGGTSNKFRIGFGETGPESEGWYPWWDGAIFIR